MLLLTHAVAPPAILRAEEESPPPPQTVPADDPQPPITLKTTLKTPGSGERLVDDVNVQPVLAYDTQSIHGVIECRRDDNTALPEDHWSGCSVVITSTSDRSAVERATLLRADAAIDDSQDTATKSDTPKSSEQIARWEFRLATPLSEGVYEIKLDTHASATSRWRGILSLDRGLLRERGDADDPTIAPESWPLIVLPSSKVTAADPATPHTASPIPPRGTLVRWSGFPEFDSASGAFAAEPLKARSSLTSRFTWGLSGGSQTGSTPAQQWGSIVNSIEQRLDTILASSADGIVLNAPNANSTSEEKLRNDLLTECVKAKANRLGLQIWEFAPMADSEASGTAPATSESTNATEQNKNVVTLRRIDQSTTPGSTTAAQELRVATLLRPSAQTIRGHFPPPMNAAADADLLWFGCRDSTSDLLTAEKQTDDAADSANLPNDLPLLKRDEAFAANCWLQDWARWVVRYAPPKNSKDANQPNTCQHGLLIDETLLNGEAIPDTGSVRGALELWANCWGEDTLWLTPNRSAEPRQSVNSLVHVRYARLSGHSVLVCINDAPWPMRVTFPIPETTQWEAISPAPIESARLSTPEQTTDGATVVIPALSASVACTPTKLSPTLRYTVRIDDARSRVALLTSQVTTIVENLGLLGELAGLTSPVRSPAQTMVASNQQRVTRGASTGAADRTSDTGSSSWASVLWSTDRWSVTRAISPSGPAKERTESKTVSAGVTAVDRLAAPRDESSPAPSQTNCRNLLANGGFEQPHELGIPGWMHAHHPSDAVTLDSLIFSEGQKAIRMSGKGTSGSASWLISREIARPIAGRLGISMSVRSEDPKDEITPDGKAKTALAQTEKAEIRVAIEGERNGHPIRRSQTIQIANDGKWQTGRLVLEWLDVDGARDQNLRVTIDNFSSSDVWIDDIVVTDYFASANERSELQSLAYLAVQGLQHADLKPAARLMKNYWAKDLLRIAKPTSVSMLDTDSEDNTTGKKRSRFPFDVPRPTPMWREDSVTTPAISAITPPPAKSRSGIAPTEPSAPISPSQNDTRSRTVPPQTRVKADNEQTSNSTNSSSESSETIAGRIRRWLPTPLRF
ncbi:hypothetical protein [Rhodopirellula sallentina]|nr:hypothetical protein [Rhodopirellula sallentina]